MSFSGFSEEDIHRLTKTQDGKIQKGSNKANLKKVTFKSNTSINNAKLRNNHTVNNGSRKVPNMELPEEAKLTPLGNKGASEIVTTKQPEDAVENNEEKSDVPPEKPVKRILDLDEFEARQKLIEEQNRKRKELLAKALADRTKKTQEEVERLNEIQSEFKKLDLMLSSDVKILRKQIEVASIDYMECQKKFHRIEKEFLEVKLQLHHKLEKKEMLTAHLCTIIEKTEERKARKLNELLQKLELNVSGNEVQSTENNVHVSNYL